MCRRSRSSGVGNQATLVGGALMAVSPVLSAPSLAPAAGGSSPVAVPASDDAPSSGAGWAPGGSPAALCPRAACRLRCQGSLRPVRMRSAPSAWLLRSNRARPQRRIHRMLLRDRPPIDRRPRQPTSAAGAARQRWKRPRSVPRPLLKRRAPSRTASAAPHATAAGSCPRSPAGARARRPARRCRPPRRCGGLSRRGAAPIPLERSRDQAERARPALLRIGSR